MKIKIFVTYWDPFQNFQTNFFKGHYYVEVKDKRYRIHPIENSSLGLRDPAQPLRTQYQVQNNTQIKKSESY